MLRTRNDSVRLICGERLIDELIRAGAVEHPPHDHVEVSLQELPHKLSAGTDLNGRDDTRVVLLHPHDRHRYEVGPWIQDRADGGFAREPRFERYDFLARKPDLGQSQAGMTNQDLAVTGRRHAAGMAVEELHIEGAFDLAQHFGGGR